jgi:hypothetical protein
MSSGTEDTPIPGLLNNANRSIEGEHPISTASLATADVRGSGECADPFLDLNSVLFVTYDLLVAATVCEEIATMQRGDIVGHRPTH